MERVVFFSKYDWSLGYQYKRISELMDLQNEWESYHELNDVIELYNVLLVIDTGLYPNNITKEEWSNYQKTIGKIKPIVAKRFAKVTDKTIAGDLDSIDISYKHWFWNILFEFNGTDSISSSVVLDILNSGAANILHFLHNKKAVKKYGEAIKNYLLNNICYVRELVSEYLEAQGANYEHYYFPDELTKQDRTLLIEKYIDSPEANANVLHLISKSKGSENLPISPKLQLKAKRRYQEKIEEISKTGISYSYGVGITYQDQEEPVLWSIEGANVKYSYDVRWIIDNLDYPTLYNNFIYLFGFVDSQFRWLSISKSSKIGIFERSIGIKGKREYPISSWYNMMEITTQAQMQSYCAVLDKNGISTEDMIKWFFEEYLPQEYGLRGFVYNKPSYGSSVLDQCRNIAIEIDSILKQFKLYCEEGEIDRELFEISTSHMLVSEIPSLLGDKYVYPNGDRIKIIFHLLFSDQSTMLYQHEEIGNCNSSYDVLKKKTICYANLQDYQKTDVDYLIEQGILSLDANQNISFSAKLLWLLYDLYENDFVCVEYLANYSSELKLLQDKGMIRFGSSLLSVPEQDYFNYIFNNASYDNSKDLRNKYAHGNQTLKEDEMSRDYFIMLRMMVLIIIKINEELCLLSSRQENK